MKTNPFVIIILFLTCLNSHNTICQHLLKEFTAHESMLFSKQEMDSIINTTTLFLLREQDMPNKMEFERAIDSVWNLTNIKVIGYNELDDYREGKYSYFILQSFNVNISPDNGISCNFSHVFLTLKLEPINYWETLNYCRIELFSDLRTMNTITSAHGGPLASLDSLYKFSTLKNWNPGQLSLYLSDVQKNLDLSKREYLYKSETIIDTLQQLTKSDTLYVPDYVEVKYNRWNGDESEKHDFDKLFKHCPMTVKIISPSALWKKMTANQVNYIFDYVKSCTDNYVRIYSLQDGKMYQAYRAMSYNLKSKDIKKIFK